MPARVFVDTNCVVYLLSNDDPEKRQAVRESLRGVAPVISTQVLNELCHVLLRKFHMPTEDVDEKVTKLVTQWECHTIDVPHIRKALQLQEQHSFSYWDALILASALDAQCQLLFTEDLQHGRKLGSLMIHNPMLR